ncbi:MAG: cytochrome c oxidase assembly protein [Chitinophagales bacterium]|nr:cytochrome c oxidase assembly protein [Hyphomicrobiales bacterium]
MLNVNRKKSTSDWRVAAWLGLLVIAMTGLSFAAVPLYQMFCQITGYGGTTQRAASAPATATNRAVTVRFDANVAPGLPWAFQPETREIKLNIGENKLGFFRAQNTSGSTTIGTSTFNVTPEGAGSYFSKIECFCFQEQSLEPGQSVELPVSFFIDPAILDDKDARNIQEITLSYTFFPVAKSAAAPQDGAAKQPLDLSKQGG